MSDYLRPKVPGATVFFTVTLAARGGSALVDHVDALREAVRRTKAERPFRVDAFVVLPDHLHAVWTLPEGDADFSTRWGAIKARFTKALRDERRPGFSPADLPTELPVVRSGRFAGLKPGRRRGKREQALWQRRFWGLRRFAEDDETSSGRFRGANGRSPGGAAGHVRTEEEFAAAVRYCHINPVKHGFVARPQDWPWSSVHREIAAGRWTWP